jgi:hypothetical protein
MITQLTQLVTAAMPWLIKSKNGEAHDILASIASTPVLAHDSKRGILTITWDISSVVIQYPTEDLQDMEKGEAVQCVLLSMRIKL